MAARKKNFARLVRDALDRTGATMTELAASCGLTRSDLYNWTNGRCKPGSFSRVEVLATQIGLHPRDLLR